MEEGRALGDVAPLLSPCPPFVPPSRPPLPNSQAGAALPPRLRAAVLTHTGEMILPATFPLGLDVACWAAGSELTWHRPSRLWPRPPARPCPPGTNERHYKEVTPPTGVDDNDYLKVRKVGV